MKSAGDLKWAQLRPDHRLILPGTCSGFVDGVLGQTFSLPDGARKFFVEQRFCEESVESLLAV